jgi:thiol-disulfide isomerase/thioredoxin
MRHHRSATILTSLLLAASAIGQNAKTDPPAPKRTIEVTIGGAAKDTIFLANYYGNKLYYNDTTVADAKGHAVFKSDRGYKAGVYAVVVPGSKYFEVIVNEPVIKLATEKDDLLPKLVVKESKENQLFIDYIRFLNTKKEEGDALRARSDAATDPIGKGQVKAQMEALDKEVKDYQHNLINSNKGTLAAELVKMSLTVDLPEPRKADGSLDSAAAYYQYRSHFWDNFDLHDDRIVRVPVFHNKLEEYITKIVPQAPDTINKLADEFIARTKEGSEVFQYVVQFITNKYQSSEIMGMDAVFVHMALTYYCPAPNKASRAYWMDDEKLEKLCERARKMAPLVIGKKAPNIILTDSTEQKWIGFHGLPNEYVVLIFWDPHCGHCKKELPTWYEVYKKEFQQLGIEVFTVAKATDETLMKDWKKFIKENDMRWVNVALTKTVYEEAKKDARKFVPQYTTLESLNYAETYDVYSTPKVFVVDGDRKLVGKSLAPEQVVDLVKQLRSRNKAKG